MEIDLEDARTIAMALISHNQKLVAEYEKIAYAGENVSEFIKQAAIDSYNEMTKAGSELHTRLAQAFPELTAH